MIDEQSQGEVLLEDGDRIVIPERTSLVMVHGEVMFPNAVNWNASKSAVDYIDQVGGFTQGASDSRIIIIRQNGEAIPGGRFTDVRAGDEIMVLPEIRSKYIEVARGLTQIIYQLAIAAKVVIDINK